MADMDWPRVVNLVLALLVLAGLAVAWGPIFARSLPWVRFVVLAYGLETVATGIGTWSAWGQQPGLHVLTYTLSLVWGVVAIVLSLVTYRREKRTQPRHDHTAED